MDNASRAENCARLFLQNMVVQHNPKLMPVVIEPGSRPPMLIKNHWKVQDQWLLGRNCCHCGGATCVGLFAMEQTCKLIKDSFPKESLRNQIRAAAKEWMERCVAKHYDVPAIKNLVVNELPLTPDQDYVNNSLYSVSDMPQCAIVVLNSYFPLKQEED